MRWLPLAAVLAVGTAMGIGLATFRYAKGLSYLSTDPKACANCHIMQSQYDSWQKASHHTGATCISCHLPQTFPQNLLAKARNGWRHSEAFTLQNFHEPIFMSPESARILQDNCVACHSATLHGTDLLVDEPARGERPCVSCHFTVGHGPRAGLGGPMLESRSP